jgi:hypothetical protein
MTIDSEIVGVYEAEAPGDPVADAIRAVRVRLLGEHVGEELGATVDVDLASPEGLVARLDALVARGVSRLRKHDLTHVEPGLLAKAVHELAGDVLDPWNPDTEKCPAA